MHPVSCSNTHHDVKDFIHFKLTNSNIKTKYGILLNGVLIPYLLNNHLAF